MSESSEKPPASIDHEAVNLLTELGIPGPIQRGFLKAGGRLCGALVDLPAAWLEGVVDNIRSTTDARRLLRIEAAKALSEGFPSNESALAVRAFAQNATKILGEQVNIEDVLSVAVGELSRSRASTSPVREPDDDWLTTFRSEASKRSSAEMKVAFGRILSGEIQNPGTTSIRAVRNVGEMDRATASLFRILCSMTLVVHGMCARVVTPGGDAAQNALQDFGLSFTQLNILHEHGLIISDFNSKLDFAQFTRLQIPISYAGRRVSLTAMPGLSRQVQIHGVNLSTIGQQLYNIVDLEENAPYTSKLAAYFKEKRILFQLS